MHTIRLQVSDKIYERLIKSLQTLKGDDLTIINEDDEFISNQKVVHEDYKLMKESKEPYLNFEEFERRLMTDD
ncbi:hypothetical protein [Ekhidna sp.]|uniref:hypothetical protein n=1 Tax=Ekhidna sp. TaxID=2608089 RepID=UPI003515F56C